MENFDIFIPVRLNNTRLPQKAMRPINGKPIIKYLIERLQSTKKIRNIVVCTTTSASDNPLVEYLEKEEILVFRGSEKDILARYLDTARNFNTDYIVSVDGDDVYTDPSYVDMIVTEFKKTNADYIDMIGFPFGIASVGIKTSALEKICQLKKTDNTETGYRLFFTQNSLFKVRNLNLSSHIKFPKNLRLTLDYEEDFILAQKIFNAIGNNFNLEKLLKLFEDNPELLKITDNLEMKYKEHWNKNLADTSIRDI